MGGSWARGRSRLATPKWRGPLPFTDGPASGPRTYPAARSSIRVRGQAHACGRAIDCEKLVVARNRGRGLDLVEGGGAANGIGSVFSGSPRSSPAAAGRRAVVGNTEPVGSHALRSFPLPIALRRAGKWGEGERIVAEALQRCGRKLEPGRGGHWGARGWLILVERASPVSSGVAAGTVSARGKRRGVRRASARRAPSG
jgi:hypothetical protein